MRSKWMMVLAGVAVLAAFFVQVGPAQRAVEGLAGTVLIADQSGNLNAL